MALFKFDVVFTIIVMVAIVNASWFAKIHVIAARDMVGQELSGLKRRLLPQLNTCFRSCTSHKNCSSDCWICCYCEPSVATGAFICI
ncbi:hypothetical protein A4A49_53467 [Nicotiana attenuata]|uniref:Carboxypeptidase A inhibitor-like domain-containing protein n=1 Tax=Nicotiana attenuata TaxID=49451 RepID=A0A1J6JRK3_NICAT|nr:hypothetical protein A4A49_53467 [Nicotiana attenuata]